MAQADEKAEREAERVAELERQANRTRR
jgi:hypothetical protein